MPVFMIRHAEALGRGGWNGDDLVRPLNKKGLRQAEGLVDLLAATDVRRAVSSPAVRCQQTIVPIAEKFGIEVEVDRRLLEGADAADALELMRDLAKRRAAVVVCTHGDVIPDVMRLLMSQGLKLHGSLHWPKGSTWELAWDGERFTDAKYHAPVE